MTTHVYTWGYAGRPVADLIAYMRDLDAVCVDIRYSPRSRDPRWNQHTLENTVRAHAEDGILRRDGPSYYHLPAYGNRNYQGGPIVLVNPVAGRAMVTAIMQHHSVILLCVCRTVETCHRSTVGHDLIAAGLCRAVEHLPSSYDAWQAGEVSL